MIPSTARHPRGHGAETRASPSPSAGVSPHSLHSPVSVALIGTDRTSYIGRNTTLPHPDANISPDACITQDDISVSRVHSRHRRSFLAKNKRATSHGIITPEMEQIYSGMTSGSSESEHSPNRDGAGRLPTIPDTPVVGHTPRPPSKDGGASFASNSSDGHGNSADQRHHFRTRLSSDGGSSVKSSKRRGMMERLGIHHQRR